LQDTWRARPDLTLTYGLRWQYLSVPYEIHGLEVIPDTSYDQFMGPRLADAAAGVPGPLPLVNYMLGGKANHAQGFYHPNWRDFAPRLSFAYNPSVTDGVLGRIFGDRKTVIRGGAGIVFDHPATSSLNFQQDQFTYVLQNVSATTYGFGESAAQALANDPRFTAVGTLPALVPPIPPSLPFTPDPAGTADGVGFFNYAIDPHLRTPYSETITFGVQRELPGNFSVDANYFGRFGRRLLGQADAGQVVDFKDPASGQKLGAAFAAISQQLRQDPTGASVTPQPFFENQIGAAIAPFGLTCGDIDTSCTNFVTDNLGSLVFVGDIGDSVQALQGAGALIPGVGLHPQFATNLYMTNKAYSDYHGLLVTLHKKESHGLQFDLNYTYSHSIDNISAPANQAFGSNGAGGILCDSLNLSVCRGNSDFDVRHAISMNAIYELPFGHGKAFASTVPGWANQIIGGWLVSGIMSWRTGLAFQTVAESFPISFANNVPAVFNGDQGAVKVNVHTDPATGQVQLFADPTKAIGAFSFPTGLEAGTRNNLFGPHYSNLDLGLSKHFSIRESMALEFRADAFNVLNHANFSLPGLDTTSDITTPDTFGVITSAAPARVLQLALRLDF
jgi:hypothetical protein